MRRRRDNGARLGRAYMAAVLLFLYVPIVVMAAMSFNASKLYRLPIDWSLTWYVALAGNERLIDASLNSLWVALVTTVVATVMGTAASLAFSAPRCWSSSSGSASGAGCTPCSWATWPWRCPTWSS